MLTKKHCNTENSKSNLGSCNQCSEFRDFHGFSFADDSTNRNRGNTNFCSLCSRLEFDTSQDWLMHLNIQGGFLSKRNDLVIFLENSNTSIICLNEHWLKTDSIKVLNSIPNFNLANYYCRKEGKHGGSCILVKNNLEYKIRNDFDVLNEDSIFELCGVEILTLNIIVISIYRVPNVANFNVFLNKLELLFKILTRATHVENVYIASDFNVDVTENCKHPNLKSEFMSLIEQYGFKTNFSSPTRITLNTQSCIDNILTLKLKSKMFNLLNLELGISDHRALLLNIPKKSSEKLNKNKTPKVKKRIFSTKNIENFVSMIDCIKWDVFSYNSFTTNCQNFFCTFQNLFEESFPLKFFGNKAKPSNKKMWVTEGIKISSKRKRELSQLAKRSNNVNFINYVKNYKRIFKNVCNESKRRCNANFIKDSVNKSKAAWTVVKSELGCKKVDHNFPDIKIFDKCINNPQEIAELFNKKFTNIAKEIGLIPCEGEAINLTKNIIIDQLAAEFNFQEVSPVEINKIIKSFEPKKSAGWDDIPMDIIRRVSKSISKPLTVIVNQSFKNCIFPDNLKLAELKPLFKKGDRQNPDNYRPVSILPSFSKILEKAASNQISSFSETNKIIANVQFAFQKGKNTGSALGNLINEVSWALDESQNTMGVFCDLSKAFDCVNHDILLQKLLVYNFSSQSIAWLKSYLKKRQQRTIISRNNVKSKSNLKEISVGVPQGSILGPILFLLYINDLPSNVSNKLILYADDTTAIVKAKSDEELSTKVCEVMTELEKWFDVNGLKLNKDKTQLVKFCTHQNRAFFDNELVFPDQTMTICKDVRFLGVDLDQHLSWNKCIDTVLKRLNSACFQMLILRDTIDLKTRIMVYYAYFHSILQYGIEFWGFSTNIDKILRVQKKILRIMTFSSWKTSCKQIFKELKILTVPNLIIFKTLMWVHSNYNLFIGGNVDHCYNTRFRGDFKYPVHRLKLTEKTPLYAGKRFFNKLPTKYKTMLNTNSFKSSLSSFLLDRSYYTIEEFLNDSL